MIWKKVHKWRTSNTAHTCLFVCLFLFGCLFRRTRNFFTYSYPTYKRSILGTHGHWAIRMQHLLWQGVSAFYGHHRGPVTITTVAERLAIELSLLGLSHLWFIHPTIRMWNKRSNRPGHYAAEAIESLYIADMQI